MPATSRQIIDSINASHPQEETAEIRNLSALEMEYGPRIMRINQYIIGVTADEDFRGGGTGLYEHNMSEKLKPYGISPEFSRWSFNDDEIEDMRTALNELSAHFEAKLDLERIFRKADVKKNHKRYYIVITIVKYPILSLQT